MLTTQVWLALADNGFEVTALAGRGSTADVQLDRESESPARYEITIVDGPLRPARLAQEATRARINAPLLVVASASPKVLAEAERIGISVLIAPQQAHEDTRGLVVHPDTGAIARIGSQPPSPAPPRQRGKAPWSTTALVIRLLDQPARTQQELADSIGVSRVRVTQILEQLDGLIVHDRDGWTVTSRSSAAEWLARSYRPASVMEETWLTLDPVVEVGRTVVDGLSRQGVRCAISGDVAADLIAPWANPTQLVVYADRVVDLEPLGLTQTPATGANVLVRIPKDPYMLRDARTVRGLPLVHPWRVWIDLSDREFPDAADALRRSLLSDAGRLAP